MGLFVHLMIFFSVRVESYRRFSPAFVDHTRPQRRFRTRRDDKQSLFNNHDDETMMEGSRRQSATAAAIQQLRLKQAETKKQQQKRLGASTSLLLQNAQLLDPNKKFSRKELEAACRRVGPGAAASKKKLAVSSPSKSNTKTNSRRNLSKNPKSPGKNRTSLSPSSPSHLSSPSRDAAQSTTDTESQVRALDNGVKLCARKYNDCKAQADELEKELQSRMDELASLQKEDDALEDMIAGNNPEAQRLQRLTADIDEANAGADDKLHYRLQLNHMHQRLRTNSVSLDKHVGAMTDTLEAARREEEQCSKMLGEVEAGFSDAVRTLNDTMRFIDLERDERSRTLATKRADAQNSSMLETWRNERETSRQELEQSLGGALRQEKETLKEQIRQRQRELKLLNREMATKASESSIVDESITKIKQATGLNDVEEVVQKFHRQKEHLDRLKAEQSDTEQRLRVARESLDIANTSSKQNQSSGYGDTEFNRTVQDELNESISNEQTQGKVVRSTNTRLEGVLVGLRQGGMGLYQKLLPFHPTLLDCEPPTLSDSSSASPIQAAYETLEILKTAGLILGKMLDAVGGIDQVIDDDANGADSNTGDSATNNLENPNLADVNCRVEAQTEMSPWSMAPPKAIGGSNAGGDNVDHLRGTHSDGLDKRIPSRDTMKAANAKVEAIRLHASPSSGKVSSSRTVQLSTPANEAQQKAMKELSKPLRAVSALRDDPLAQVDMLLASSPPLI